MKLKVLKLLVAFAFFSLVIGNAPTYAKEQSENTTESTTIEQMDGPFVDALPVPDDAIEFLKERKMDIIHLEDIDDIETADIFFGEAFSMHNYTQPQEYMANKFPIFNHDTCIAVVGIYKGSRGQYTWTTSHGGEFCEKVTEVARQKGKFRLGESLENLSETEVVKHDNPIDGIGKASILTPICTISVEELKQKQIADSLTERTGNYPYSKTLPMNPKEKQTTLPWCAAYAAARILSYELSKDIRARDIMEWTYWHWYSKPNLDTYTLSKEQIVKYAHHMGSSPYIVDRSLYREEIMEEISNERMIYASGVGVNGTTGRHAFVVYGYGKDKEYRYWNPWGEADLTSDMSDNTLYTRGGDRFDWDSSIRNFTW